MFLFNLMVFGFVWGDLFLFFVLLFFVDLWDTIWVDKCCCGDGFFMEIDLIYFIFIMMRILLFTLRFLCCIDLIVICKKYHK
jgi:hypothetical protein